VFNEFFSRKISNYRKNSQKLYLDSTSRLSPYLVFGNISVRKCVKSVLTADYDQENKQDYDRWLEKLILRDFYYQFSFNFPDEIKVTNTENHREWNIKYQHFLSWCRGTTGFPLIDAAMRELNSKSWI